jgi:FtsH-binding integral membrane protein
MQLSLLKSKLPFLMEVYTTLIIELFITFGVLYYLRKNRNSPIATQSFWLYLGITFVLILVLAFIPMPVWLKLVLFTMFSLVFGALLFKGSGGRVPEELINKALIGCIAIFVGMSIFAFILASFGVDLSFMVGYLFAALIGLLVAWVILAFVKEPKFIRKLLFTFALVLFSIYVMFSTNVMLQKNYADDFVSAAIDLFLSFVNIFTSLLGLGES